VLLDALGTLVRLIDPVPALQEALGALGVAVDPDHVRAALAQEIGYYRAHHLQGATPERLQGLRRQCARVLGHALGPPASGVGLEPLLGALLSSLRFEAYPDAVPALAALRARGLPTVVVSNWDISLRDVLAGCGLQVDGVVTSAAVGAAKPSPLPVRAALDRAGVQPHEALLVGDTEAEDLPAARAAGVRCVLICRDAGPGPAGVEVIHTLEALVPILGTRHVPRDLR
jgi:putative hydrolase of the HAD superfamily